MNDVSRLEKALDTFQKNVDTSFAGPIPNSLLARQDLEQAIVVLSDRLTPFRDRVSRIKGEGLAHLWNQRTSLDTLAAGPSGLVNVFYADGNLPTQNDPAYAQKTAAYKYLKVLRHISVKVYETFREFGETPYGTIPSQALQAIALKV